MDHADDGILFCPIKNTSQVYICIADVLQNNVCLLHWFVDVLNKAVLFLIVCCLSASQILRFIASVQFNQRLSLIVTEQNLFKCLN